MWILEYVFKKEPKIFKSLIIDETYRFGRDQDKRDKYYIDCPLLSISKDQFTFEPLLVDAPTKKIPRLRINFNSKASTIVNGAKYKCLKDKSSYVKEFNDEKLDITFRDSSISITIQWIPLLLMPTTNDVQSNILEETRKLGITMCHDPTLASFIIARTGDNISDDIKKVVSQQNTKVLNIEWVKDIIDKDYDIFEQSHLNKFMIDLQSDQPSASTNSPINKKRTITDSLQETPNSLDKGATPESDSSLSVSQKPTGSSRKRPKLAKPNFEDLFSVPIMPHEPEVPPELAVTTSEQVPMFDNPTQESIREKTPEEGGEIQPSMENTSTDLDPISPTKEDKHTDEKMKFKQEPVVEQVPEINQDPGRKFTQKRKITLEEIKNTDDTEVLKEEDVNPKRQKRSPASLPLIKAIRATKQEADEKIDNDLKVEELDENELNNKIDSLVIVETFEVEIRQKPSTVDNSQKYAGRKNFKKFKKNRSSNDSSNRVIIPLEDVTQPKYIPLGDEEEYESAYTSQFSKIKSEGLTEGPNSFIQSITESNDIFVGEESQISQDMETPSNRPSPRDRARKQTKSYRFSDDDEDEQYKKVEEDEEDEDEDSELPRFAFSTK